MNEYTTDTGGDRPKRFVSRAWLEQYLQSGTGRLTILSGSMAPLINTGDQICVRKTPLGNIHIGDIITFWKGEVLVTHRVIRTCLREGSVCFVERGDAAGHHALCRGQSVIGRVIAVKKGKREIDFATFRWKACNRLIGIGLLGAYAARVYGRKLPGVPQWIRACVRRAYAVAARLRNKVLRFLLSRRSVIAPRASSARSLDCQTYQCAQASFANGTTLTIFIPGTAALKTMGLSNTRSLLENHGMLFAYEADGFWGIWMKDMQYPLDILWLDESLRIVHIESSVKPSTYPHVFTPSAPARYILEVGAGVVAKNGVKLFDRVFCER